MAEQSAEASPEVSGTSLKGPTIWLYGLSKEHWERLQEHFNAKLFSTEDLPAGMQNSNTAAAVELEKSFTRQADIVIVNCLDISVEAICIANYAWSVGKAQCIVLYDRMDVPWINLHANAVLGTEEEAIQYVESIIKAARI